MHLFKLFVGALLSPLCLASLVAALGLILRAVGRRRASTFLFSFAALFAWLVATPLAGGWLIAPLESQYQPLPANPVPWSVHFIVVLGSDYDPHDGVPITAAIDEAGFRRVVEGVRLQRLNPGSRLVFSGGAFAGSSAPATGNTLLAMSLGVPDDAIVQLMRPLDTRGEAAEVRQLIGSDHAILVTSAAHMPRAMEYMRRAGVELRAAPTGQRYHERAFHVAQLLPSANGLRMSEDAFHEYLGWIALYADLG